jgi:hypothetical protein
MICFQLAKQVLDKMYQDFSQPSEDKKDGLINKALAYLGNEYQGLAAGSQITYSHLALTFAYIYKYVPIHANVVFQRISASSDLADLFRQERVNIVCLGGGPGSDVLGILKYIDFSGDNPALYCITLDKEEEWRRCWEVFERKLQSHGPLTNIYQSFDVSDTKTWPKASSIARADLFIMNYFMSEIDSLRDAAEPFFEHLIGNAKAGALFLYIDNNHEQFYTWFDSIASAHRLQVTSSYEGLMGFSDNNEEKTDLGEFYDKFGWPLMKPNIASRVCRKG